MSAMRFFMFLFILALPAIACVAPAAADEAATTLIEPGAAKPDVAVDSSIDKAMAAIDNPRTGPLSFDDARLDNLFAELKRTRDPDVAQVLAEQVRAQFRTTRSATLDMLVNQADRAAGGKNYGAALDYLDQVIVLDPSYVEGWNRRATLHYMMGNPKKSMADIAEVLARDPRHIGALAGMAGILGDNGRKPQALKVWQRYLDIYPADKNAQKAFSDLAEEISGQKT